MRSISSVGKSNYSLVEWAADQHLKTLNWGSFKIHSALFSNEKNVESKSIKKLKCLDLAIFNANLVIHKILFPRGTQKTCFKKYPIRLFCETL